MTLRSPQKMLRELLQSRSAAASAVRVCAIVVLAQSALFVARAPFAARSVNDLLVMEIDTGDTARYRNATHVNGKALASLLAELVQTLGARVRAPDAQRSGEDMLAHMMRESDDQVWALKRTLQRVMPEVNVVAPAAAESGRPAAVALPLPARYLPELHKVVMFDQWLPAGELTVWMSPLSDSLDIVRGRGMNFSAVSVCVSHRGRPQLAAIYIDGQVHWGIHGRGNDLGLGVGPPMWLFPERFGVQVSSEQDMALAKTAFFEDADVFRSLHTGRSLMGALALSTDALLLTKPTPLRTLCAGHTFLRLYGGRLTDLEGREVEYPASGGSTQGTVLAALYFHQRLRQQVVDAKAGRNVTRILVE